MQGVRATFSLKASKGHTDSKSLTTFLRGCFFGGESLIARRESDIQFESKKRSHVFEKSNDFSGGDKIKAKIAKHENKIQFDSRKKVTRIRKV